MVLLAGGADVLFNPASVREVSRFTGNTSAASVADSDVCMVQLHNGHFGPG